ncbi:MAG: DNA-binding protein [Actinobacteria bacterium]|nr:DNA-binding protein [Actinomycetota bacterium]
MKVQLSHGDGGLRTYVAVLDKGDEAVSALTEWAAEEGVRGSSLAAIGAFQRATVAYFDRDTMNYQEIPVSEQVEVLSLLGNIGIADDEPKLHAHVVLGRRDGTTVGGHLLEGVVWPTLEVFVTEAPAPLRRSTDEETGLPLIDIDRG